MDNQSYRVCEECVSQSPMNVCEACYLDLYSGIPVELYKAGDYGRDRQYAIVIAPKGVLPHLEFQDGHYTLVKHTEFPPETPDTGPILAELVENEPETKEEL